MAGIAASDKGETSTPFPATLESAQEARTMRILWHSNSPWASTGYGNQTALFVPRIKALGHEIAVSCLYGLSGGLLDWNGIRCYPNGRAAYGQDVMAAHAQSWHADIVISLIDVWVMEPDLLPDTIKFVPWFPVDMSPLSPPIFKVANNSFDRLVFSRFGERMVKEAGLNCRYIPHGTDTKAYSPIGPIKARETLKLEQKRFVVGMVAANKGVPSRKAFDPQIRAFAKLRQAHPDAQLMLHTDDGTGGSPDQVNLPELCQFYGLTVSYHGAPDCNKADVIICDQYTNLLGYPQKYMQNLYSACDVLSSVTMGEGFGVPILEAQSCGCPVVVGDWTAMSELCFSGWKVDKQDADEWYTPMAAYQYMPRYDAIYRKLEAAYEMRGNQSYRSRARDGALAYDADKITQKYWKPALEAIEKNL